MPNPSAEARAPLIVQITDPHLFGDEHGRLLGMNTRDSLEKVIDRVLAEQPQIDLLLITGDLTQDGSVASYEAFRRMSARIEAPTRWFAGNHDEPAVMEEVAAGTDLLDPVIDIGNWRITLLNSAVSGSVPGFLAESELNLLAQSLSEAPERHHLICLHHHPISIDCKWMEPIGLRNPKALFSVLERFPQTRALLWGHIHQEIDQPLRDLDLGLDLRLLATPSTCIQFKPRSDDFALDDLPPGYRWLRLLPDGKIDTAVSRVEGYAFKPDFSSEGY